MPTNISKYEFYRIHYVCFERSLIYLNNSDVVNRKMTEFFFSWEINYTIFIDRNLFPPYVCLDFGGCDKPVE